MHHGKSVRILQSRAVNETTFLNPEAHTESCAVAIRIFGEWLFVRFSGFLHFQFSPIIFVQRWFVSSK